jgi:hypothetical protein
LKQEYRIGAEIEAYETELKALLKGVKGYSMTEFYYERARL